MDYRVISQPINEPISLEEARSHLRLIPYGSPESHPDDADILQFIKDAREWVEKYLNRSLATKTIEFYATEFLPRFDLSLLPIQSIDSISYLATDNTTKTVSPSIYKLKAYDDTAKLILAYNQQMPSDVIPEEDAITITVSAGYTNGSSPDTYPLPHPIKAAMLLIIGHLYENRQEDVLGNTRISFNSLPLGVYNLIQPYRLGLGM